MAVIGTLADCAAELDRRRLVGQRREHDLVRAPDVVGERQHGRAVQRAQLCPRALLEQAFEALAGRPGRNRVPRVRLVLQAPQPEELAERGFGRRVVAVLASNWSSRSRRRALPQPAAARRTSPCVGTMDVDAVLLRLRCRRGRGERRVAVGACDSQQRPGAERHERDGRRDRPVSGPAQPRRRDRSAIDFGGGLSNVGAPTRCSSRVKAPSSARSQITLITRGIPPLSR